MINLRSTSKKTSTAETFGRAIAQILILFPAGGWALMTILAILHDASAAVPALGYLTCVALVVLTSIVKSGIAPHFDD